MRVLDYMNKHPKVGWGVAGGILVLALLVFILNRPSSETNELAETVTIRCRETGQEWTMTRGAMEKQLMLRSYPVNPEEGLLNPDTGRPTGFPVDDWNKTVKMINDMRSERAEKDKAKKPAPPKK
jgi:hypothetical protein